MKINGDINWDLLRRRMGGELSEEEERQFREWMNASLRHREYYERMCRVWNSDTIYKSDVHGALAKFDELLEQEEKRRRRVIGRRMLRWSVAAAVLLGMAGGLSLWFQQPEKSMPLAVNTIVPGESRAILVLPDGTNIGLNKTTDTSVLRIEGAEIRLQEGVVHFTDQAGKPEAETNAIIIPRGSEYHIVLSDGSEVWMNADSKLRFPAHFGDGERRVVLTGEAYFAVNHNSEWPFIVETDLGNIRVYGTEFNVKRYGKGVRATLVKGSIGFCKKGALENYLRIEPGFQVSCENGREPVVRKVKVRNEIAWKNKQFCFERQPLYEIMEELMRWYDVNITFEDESLKELYFTGTLNRYEHIGALLRFFEASCDICFKIEGRNITIRRK